MSLVLIVAGAAILGRPVMQGLRLEHRLEAWTCAFLLGLVLCAVIALILGSISLAWAQIALGALVLAGLVWELFLYSRRARLPESAPPDTAAATPCGFFEMACLAATGAALLMTLISAFAPVTSWDATVAHIALPADYAREGRIGPQPGNVYSGYPHLMHCLYAVAYYDGGEKPVTLLNWVFAAMACCAAFNLGLRLAGRRAGLIGAAILASAPIFMDQGSGVSIDLAFAAFATAALAALLRYFDAPHRGWLIVAALLAGSSCGARHTGLLVCALLAAGLLIGAKHSRVRETFLFASIAALAALPWLLRSALLTGNPVFPFFLDYFPARGIEHTAITGIGAHESVARSGGMRLLEFLRFPWDIVMRPGRYDGWAKSPGAMVLALGVPGFIIGGRRARAVGLYAAAGGICFFFFQRLARYILPFFIPMMALAGLAAVRLKPLSRPIMALLLLSFLYGLALHTAAIHFKVPVVLGMESREEYLLRRVERYEAFRYINQFCNDGGVVLTADQRSYYLDPPAFQNHWAMKRLREMTPETQRGWLRAQEIKYVLMPLDFVRESGALAGELMPMFHAWQNDPAHFRLLRAMNLPRLRGSGLERVEIYELLPE